MKGEMAQEARLLFGPWDKGKTSKSQAPVASPSPTSAPSSASKIFRCISCDLHYLHLKGFRKHVKKSKDCAKFPAPVIVAVPEGETSREMQLRVNSVVRRTKNLKHRPATPTPTLAASAPAASTPTTTATATAQPHHAPSPSRQRANLQSTEKGERVGNDSFATNDSGKTSCITNTTATLSSSSRQWCCRPLSASQLTMGSVGSVGSVGSAVSEGGDAVFANLPSHLHCPKCRFGFNLRDRSPKKLPCYHTVCQSCVVSFSSELGLNNPICPMTNCRKRFKWPTRGVRDIPSNWWFHSALGGIVSRGHASQQAWQKAFSLSKKETQSAPVTVSSKRNNTALVYPALQPDPGPANKKHRGLYL